MPEQNIAQVQIMIVDRMDITGARWSLAGAEAVRKLRALISNGDLDTSTKNSNATTPPVTSSNTRSQPEPRTHSTSSAPVSGETHWRSLDELHRTMLDEVLAEHGLTKFSDDDRAELVGAWHRLRPWPDSRDGLSQLRKTTSLPPCPMAAPRCSSTSPARADCSSTPSCRPN
jgi:hypothetical protein